jgi:tetratricopeptide (TPR) repeat protein
MSDLRSHDTARPRDLPDFEDRLERFDAAWRAGMAPQMDAFLPPPGAAGRLRLLEELIKIDLEYRWRAADQPADPADTPRAADGQSAPGGPRLEDYAAHFPELGPPALLPVELVGEEYRVRQRWGDRPGHADFAARFPGHGAALESALARIDAELAADPRAGAPARQDDSGGQIPAAVSPPFSRVGRYELVDLLGSGAFGSVWRGLDTELKREVAVKLPRLGRFPDPAQEERFLREARSAARLQHTGIVTIHDVGRDRDTVYIVSDLVRGVSLQKWLAGEPPSFRAAAELAAHVADALDYAHRHGVIHRDLKPANILLHRKSELPPFRPETAVGYLPAFGFHLWDFEPKLTDFGLAKCETADAHVPVESQIVGTPAYMSPEQILRPHTADRRSDVYSLGVILYELLTGEVPFRGEVNALLQQVARDEPQPPRRLNGKVPPDLQTIALKCLDKDPARRYPTAGTLAADLRRWLAGEPIQARPISPWQRGLKWARRRPAWAALWAVVVVAGVGLTAGATWHDLALRQAFRDTDLQRQELHKTLLVAELERDEARQNLRQALETTDEMFEMSRQNWTKGLMLDLVRQSRMGMPVMVTPEQRQHLEKALAFYRKVVEKQRCDPGMRRETAQALTFIGEINALLRQHADAETALRQALTLREHLAEQHAGDAKYQQDLVQTNLDLHEVYVGMALPDQAETALKKVLQILEKMVAKYPDAGYRQQLQDNYHKLADFYKQQGRKEDTLEAYRSVVRTWARLVAENPLVSSYAVDLGWRESQMGGWLNGYGRFEEALEWHTRAIDRLEAILAKEPANYMAKKYLESCYAGHANTLQYLNRSGEAVQDWDRAIELERGDVEFATRTLMRAKCVALLGDHAGAAATAWAATANTMPNGNVLYNAACVASQCSAVAGKDAKLSEAERQKLANEYAARAVELLRRAAAVGFFQFLAQARDQLKTDKDLDPVRSRADFKKLLAEVEGKALRPLP